MVHANCWDLCFEHIVGLQMCWKSYKTTAKSHRLHWEGPTLPGCGLLKHVTISTAAVLGKLVKKDQAFSSQATIQVGSLALGSIVGSSHGTKPPPQVPHDPSAPSITVMLLIGNCYFMRDLLTLSLGVVDLLAALQSGWPLGTFKLPFREGATKTGGMFCDPTQFICITAIIHSWGMFATQWNKNAHKTIINWKAYLRAIWKCSNKLVLGINSQLFRRREWTRSLQCPETQAFGKHEALQKGRFKCPQILPAPAW